MNKLAGVSLMNVRKIMIGKIENRLDTMNAFCNEMRKIGGEELSIAELQSIESEADKLNRMCLHVRWGLEELIEKEQ